MSLDTRRANLRARHTFSAITDILSFLSGEHGHAVCFKILVELPWIGVEAFYSTGNGGPLSVTLSKQCSAKCHYTLCQLSKQIRPHNRSKL